MKHSIKTLFPTLFIALILSSCGGGGGGGGGVAAPNALPVPTGVSATFGDASNTVSWMSVSDATSYNIYWSTSSGVSKANGTKIADVSSPYAHTGLVNGTRYYYVVTAVSAGGESDASARVNATPFGALSGVSATARDGNNVIGWAGASNSVTYNIYWSTAAGVTTSSINKITLANNPQTHTGLTNGTPYYYVVTMVKGVTESMASPEVSAMPAAVTSTPDPLYQNQWNLKNTGQLGANGVSGVPTQDINVEPVWLDVTTPRKGEGIRIAIVDDGMEIGHEDLAANVAATGLSYNYVTGSSDPTNDPTDTTSGHGTEVTGIAAARDLNGLGGRGVAPRANLAGFNLLQKDTASDEADAMTRGSPDVHIYSNSWGATDGYGTLDASTQLWRNAIDSGIVNGRGGLGAIYTWAAGNGGAGGSACPSCIDNSNYDGQANYRGVIAVTSVNDQGKQSSYSEPGANIWISAPGGEYCNTHTITTTDRTGAVGDNPPDPAWGYTDYTDTNYTKCMNGTSAATPQAAGVIALMLQANPTLGWRDVRLILAQSARNNDATDAGWTTGVTVPPYHFNHKYGFGVVNAGAAVALASTWIPLVGAQLDYPTALSSPSLLIPDNNVTGVSDTINVSGSGINNIEFIEITFSAADHTYSGDLAITLTSPAGTVSHLSETHHCANSTCTPYDAWIFGSARHLGEAADGYWTLTVVDGAPVKTGHFQSWGLKFYGH